MLESFFVQYIVPEFKSPHGFLRSRACDLVEKYESVDMVWADQNVGLSPFAKASSQWSRRDSFCGHQADHFFC